MRWQPVETQQASSILLHLAYMQQEKSSHKKHETHNFFGLPFVRGYVLQAPLH